VGVCRHASERIGVGGSSVAAAPPSIWCKFAAAICISSGAYGCCCSGRGLDYEQVLTSSLFTVPGPLPSPLSLILVVNLPPPNPRYVCTSMRVPAERTEASIQQRARCRT